MKILQWINERFKKAYGHIEAPKLDMPNDDWVYELPTTMEKKMDSPGFIKLKSKFEEMFDVFLDAHSLPKDTKMSVETLSHFQLWLNNLQYAQGAFDQLNTMTKELVIKGEI